jgi:hypothetical protein
MRSCDFFLIAPYLNLEKLDLLLGEDYSPSIYSSIVGLRCWVGGRLWLRFAGLCASVWGVRVWLCVC